jgi:serine/threonine protein kinase
MTRRKTPLIFGAYELLEPLGQGGMGVVYRGRKLGGEGDQSFAIKLLKSSMNGDDRARFAREAEALARVDRHPSVVRVFSADLQAPQPYLVMELIEGSGTLMDRLQAGPLSLDEALRIALEIASALEHMHKQGVIHRDLKPENVLLDSEGKVRLTDFGLAAMSGSVRLTATGVIVGTPGYIAPEIVTGQGVTDRADLWALGALLYFMLTGRPPFDVRDPASYFRQVRSERPQAVSSLRADVPKSVENLVFALLESNPAERLQTASQVIASLKALILDTPDALPLPQGQDLKRRGRIGAALGLLFVLILTITAIRVAMSKSPADRSLETGAGPFAGRLSRVRGLLREDNLERRTEQFLEFSVRLSCRSSMYPIEDLIPGEYEDSSKLFRAWEELVSDLPVSARAKILGFETMAGSIELRQIAAGESPGSFLSEAGPLIEGLGLALERQDEAGLGECREELGSRRFQPLKEIVDLERIQNILRVLELRSKGRLLEATELLGGRNSRIEEFLADELRARAFVNQCLSEDSDPARELARYCPPGADRERRIELITRECVARCADASGQTAQRRGVLGLIAKILNSPMGAAFDFEGSARRLRDQAKAAAGIRELADSTLAEANTKNQTPARLRDAFEGYALAQSLDPSFLLPAQFPQSFVALLGLKAIHERGQSLSDEQQRMALFVRIMRLGRMAEIFQDLEIEARREIHERNLAQTQDPQLALASALLRLRHGVRIFQGLNQDIELAKGSGAKDLADELEKRRKNEASYGLRVSREPRFWSTARGAARVSLAGKEFDFAFYSLYADKDKHPAEREKLRKRLKEGLIADLESCRSIELFDVLRALSRYAEVIGLAREELIPIAQSQIDQMRARYAEGIEVKCPWLTPIEFNDYSRGLYEPSLLLFEAALESDGAEAALKLIDRIYEPHLETTGHRLVKVIALFRLKRRPEAEALLQALQRELKPRAEDRTFWRDPLRNAESMRRRK